MELLTISHSDGKRKAEEEPSSPTPSKRIKQDDSAEPPEKKPEIKRIPFPEKVGLLTNLINIPCTHMVITARRHRRAQWRNRIPSSQQRQRARITHYLNRTQVYLSKTTSQNA